MSNLLGRRNEHVTPRRACVAVAVLSALLGLGCAALAVAHAGLGVPLLSRIGPEGDRAVIPAAVAFSIATIVLAAVAVGAWRARPWAWALGIAVHGLVFLGSAVPYRGPASLVGLIISGACVALLLTRPGRQALLAR